MLQNFILFITFIVLVWYTIETYKLRKQSEKQTNEIIKQKELSVRPFLNLLFYHKNESCELGSKLLVLENKGNGPALNIKIQIIKKNKGIVKDVNIKFLDIPIIASNDQCNIWESYIEMNKIQPTWTKKHYITPQADCFNEYTLKITYQDILNNYYEAIIKTNINFINSFEIIEQKKIL